MLSGLPVTYLPCLLNSLISLARLSSVGPAWQRGATSLASEGYGQWMSTTTGLSVEEFLERDWTPDTQLVDGEVVVNDPTFWHQHIAGLIYAAVLDWSRQGAGRGMPGLGGNWVLAAGQVYKPDVWWAGEDRVPRREAARSDTPPDLVVEVRSPRTWSIDVGRKRRVYEDAGVAELWLVDTPARVVLVLRRSRPEEPTFDVALELGEEEQLSSPLLPGFALPVAEIFQ